MPSKMMAPRRSVKWHSVECSGMIYLLFWWVLQLSKCCSIEWCSAECQSAKSHCPECHTSWLKFCLVSCWLESFCWGPFWSMSFCWMQFCLISVCQEAFCRMSLWCFTDSVSDVDHSAEFSLKNATSVRCRSFECHSVESRLVECCSSKDHSVKCFLYWVSFFRVLLIWVSFC